MTNVFTLDDIDKSLNETYAPMIFQAGKNKYTLRQILRMSSTEREAVVAKLEMLQETTEEDMTEDMVRDTLTFVLRTATADNKGDELVASLEGDLLRLKVLFEHWMENTQAGEAPASSV
jgi:hypothetical protein